MLDSGTGPSDPATGDSGTADAGSSDAGTADAGTADGGSTDAGSTDAGGTDAGSTDAGSTDAGSSDAGGTDAGSTDAGSSDAGSTDAGSTDAGSSDAGSTDAGGSDAGSTDAGGSDAGGTDAGGTDAGEPCDGVGLAPLSVIGDAGEWSFALPSGFANQRVSITGASVTAFSSQLGEPVVAGFVADFDAPQLVADAGSVATALVDRLRDAGSVLGAGSSPKPGKSVLSPEGLPAVVWVDVPLTPAAPSTPVELRNRALAALMGRPGGDFSNLPASGGSAAPSSTLRLAVTVRPATGRLLVVAALVDSSNTAALDVFGDGTAVRATAGRTLGATCEAHHVDAGPAVDVIWVMSLEASMDNDRTRVASHGTALLLGLGQAGFDPRVGVVPDPSNRRIFSLRGITGRDAGVLRSTFTRAASTLSADLLLTTNPNTGDETNEQCVFALTAGDDAIATASPRTPLGSEAPTRLREDALLVVVYASDQHAQEIEQNTCGNGSFGTGVVPGNRNNLPPSPAQQASIDLTIKPFVDRLVAEQGVALGVVTPVQAPFCSDSEDGRGFVDVIARTGGAHMRVCDASLSPQLLTPIDQRAGSWVRLGATPISSTLEVDVTLGDGGVRAVPRSATDGFRYVPGTNAVVITGPNWRPAAGSRVAVRFRRWD